MISGAFGWLAALSLALGTPTAAQTSDDKSVTVGLCEGGTIAIQFDTDPDGPKAPCPKAGCHAGLCRGPKLTSSKRGGAL